MKKVLCVVESSKTPREKKSKRVGAGSSVCTLGLLPRVQEVRKWATSVMSPPDLRERFINLSGTSTIDPKHTRYWQIKIEGVRSASAVERILQWTSIREEPIRPKASCGWSTETRHTVWLHCDDQITAIDYPHEGNVFWTHNSKIFTVEV